MLSREPSPELSDCSSVPEEDDSYIVQADDPVAAYGLRKNRPRTFATTINLDADDDENFDPDQEKREQAQKLNQARMRKKKNQKKAGKAKRKLKRAPKLIVRLRIVKFGTVLNITNMEENWPDGYGCHLYFFLVDCKHTKTDSLKVTPWMTVMMTMLTWIWADHLLYISKSPSKTLEVNTMILPDTLTLADVQSAEG